MELNVSGPLHNATGLILKDLPNFAVQYPSGPLQSGLCILDGVATGPEIKSFDIGAQFVGKFDGVVWLVRIRLIKPPGRTNRAAELGGNSACRIDRSGAAL